MKRAYTKPAMQVAEIQQAHIVCTSGWDTIGPDDPNKPAGAPAFGFGSWNL